MADRISKAQIQSLVVRVGQKFNLPTKGVYIKDRSQGQNLYQKDFLSADHNSIYGGWILMVVKKESGGEDYFDRSMMSRVSTKEFYAYLKGLLK